MTDDTSTTATNSDRPTADGDVDADSHTDGDVDADSHTDAGTDRDGDPPLDALADHLTPLATTDPTADFDDLDPLGDALADTTVVALGEATHGTREFFRLKHRLLRYIVVEHGVRAFAMEANLPEAEAIDAYVVDGEGDPAEALAGIYFWTWQTEAVRDLLDWLRAFNADRPREDRVRFYGFDAQYTQGAVDRLVDFLAEVDADFLARVREDLDRVADDGTAAFQDDDLDERIAAAERVVPEIRDRLDANREDYVAAAGESTLDLARRHLRVVEQATEYKRATRTWQANEDDPDAMSAFLAVRDRAMAENVEWVVDREADAPVVLWAHDAHSNRREHSHRTSAASAPAMGNHLAATYGEDYYALGFAFARGGFQAVGQEPTESGSLLQEFVRDEPVAGTVEAALADLDVPLGVLDVREATADDRAAVWLSTPQPHFSLGATYDPAAPDEDYVTEYAYGEAFDALCYVDETSRARPLQD